MKAIMLAVAVAMLAGVGASAANFPYIRLNNQTNRISDSGSALTRDGIAIGGGSSSPFTNIAGVVQYAPAQAATNLLNVVSGLADNATNAAMIVDTSVPWTGADSNPGSGQLASFRNNGTNVVLIGSSGRIAIGRHADLYEGAPFDQDELTVVRDSSVDDISHVQVNFASVDDATTYNNFGDIVFRADNGISGVTGFTMSQYSKDITNNLQFSIQLLQTNAFFGAYFLKLTDQSGEDTSPTVWLPSGYDGDAYKFGTTFPKTNGYLLQSVNAGTNKFTVPFDGSITTGGNTNRWILGAPETNNIVVDTTRFLWITNNGTAYKVVIAQ